MFTSNDDLKLDYGVDLEIGKYIVDREVPQNNLYWKKRHLYIIPMPGYLFIPIYLDIQKRLGIATSDLLAETHLQSLEAILHSAAKLEFNEIDQQQHIAECAAIVEANNQHPALLDDLTKYMRGSATHHFKLGAPYPALERADAYLFSLCMLPADNIQLQKMINAWYGILTYYLLVDDVDDLQADYEKSEENALLQAGNSKGWHQLVKAILDDCYEQIKDINPVFANRIDHTRSTKKFYKKIDKFLAQNPGLPF